MAHYGTLILKKNLYFEAILMKFQKGGVVAPPAPLFPTLLLMGTYCTKVIHSDIKGPEAYSRY